MIENSSLFLIKQIKGRFPLAINNITGTNQLVTDSTRMLNKFVQLFSKKLIHSKKHVLFIARDYFFLSFG